MTQILGIDIGGTKIFHGIVDEKGNILSEIKKEFTPKTSVLIEEKLKEIISLYEGKVSLAGIATAGAVSLGGQRILSSTANMPEGYRDIDFMNLNEKIPVYLENDANAASYAEYKIGNAKGYKNAIILTLGTGVGGGIITDGKLLKGKSGAAGEMHFVICTDKKRKCTCGAYDCFEAYASGRGLKLTYQDVTGMDLTTYEIIEKYNNGEKNAQEALKLWNYYIALGALSLNNIFDTDIIALSGSMAEFADVDYIEKYVNDYTVTTNTKVVKCALKNHAGLIGAALIACNKMNPLQGE